MRLYVVPVMTAKCNLITLSHVTHVHNYYARQEKEKSGENMSRHYTRYTKKAKQVGVVGDDSLTGPVVAGRLDETTRQAQQMIALA